MANQRATQWAQTPDRFDALCKTRRTRFKDNRHHPLARGFWPGCVAVDRMTREQLLALQAERLQDLVEHAVAHTPFYRQWASDSGFRAGDKVVLDTLPVVRKSDYIGNIDAFQSEAVPVDEMKQTMTSGSSGQPFILRKDQASRDYSYCVLWRALARFGLGPGDRRVYIWGRRSFYNSTPLKIAVGKAKYRLRDWLNVTLSVDAYALTERSAAEALERIERFRPVYMHGYVSALYALATRLEREGRTLGHLNLKAVVTESEKLYPFQRDAMARAFRCPILEHYGSIEIGNMAEPDPDGHMRINEDLALIERTEAGEAVITNLFSRAFPFIRYHQGDLIERIDPPPPGLPYATLSGIVGRTVDLIPLKAGGCTPGRALTYVVDPHLDRVSKYQIHQHTLDRFTVRMVLRDQRDESLEQVIRRDLRMVLGESTQIDFEYPEEIPPAPSGKFRWIVSDLAGQADPQTIHEPAHAVG